ncbi:MAG: hypothetical protein LBD50_01640 [Rickettsiales bacterium]|jgi:hypothetical protein|nr:hypothetical protein [Rickettsiales bacterium]
MPTVNIKSFQGIRTITPEGVEVAGRQSAADSSNIYLRPNQNSAGFGLYSLPKLSELAVFPKDNIFVSFKLELSFRTAYLACPL